jgi:signal peptidase I
MASDGPTDIDVHEQPTSDQLDPTPPTAGHRRRRLVTEWVVILIVAAVVSLVIRTFIFQTFYIPSGSMNPTLWKGDRIIVNKLSVTFGTINTGDVLVFKAPAAVAADCGDSVADLVKRVIGLPGQRLYSVGNTIYVNGKVLDQKWPHYVSLGGSEIAPKNNPIVVPANHYFMMGDNHYNSCDSRTWGTVPRSNIIGKAFIKIWPLSHFGFL